MKKLIIFKIDFQLLIYLIIGFIFTTALGTVLHEFGHFIVAEFLGISAKIHYGYTNFIYDENYRNLSKYDKLFITLGGPAQTIITGILGLILLYKNKDNSAQNVLNLKSWLFVFISLFWLRQTANLVMWFVGYLLTDRFSMNGDEVKLAVYFKIPLWFFIVPSGIIGGVISVLVIFKFIPINQRFTFIISGLIGGVLGYIIWLESLGEILMP